MADLPITCTLTPGELRARGDDLLPGLAARAQASEAVAHGYRLRFASIPGMLADIVTVVEAERRCCRFLRFELTIEPGDGPIWLSLTGPSGTREFLAGLLAR